MVSLRHHFFVHKLNIKFILASSREITDEHVSVRDEITVIKIPGTLRTLMYTRLTLDADSCSLSRIFSVYAPHWTHLGTLLAFNAFTIISNRLCLKEFRRLSVASQRNIVWINLSSTSYVNRIISISSLKLLCSKLSYAVHILFIRPSSCQFVCESMLRYNSRSRDNFESIVLQFLFQFAQCTVRIPVPK